MKVAVATCPQFFVEENAIIQALFEEGLDLLHIRKPDSEPIFCERLLTLVPSKWYGRIIVNDHFYLHNEYNLKGIHLSTRNPEPPHDYNDYISCSCQIDEIDRKHERYGHLVIDATPSLINKAAESHKITKKIWVRGVTTLDGVQFVKDKGFGGIVLEDVIWSKFDFHESYNYKELIDLFKNFRKAAD